MSCFKSRYISKLFPWVRVFALTSAKNPCQIKSLARSTCMHMLILPPTLLYWMPKTQHQDKNGHPKSSDNIKILWSFFRVFFSVCTWRKPGPSMPGGENTATWSQANGVWGPKRSLKACHGTATSQWFPEQKAWHGNMKGSEACSWTARILFLLLLIVMF